MIGLGTLDSFNNVLQQSVASRICVVVFYVIEADGTKVKFDGRMFYQGGKVCTEIAKYEGCSKIAGSG